MHSTDLCPGKGRKACLQYVSGQTGHYPLGRDPETLEPSSDTFLANSPSRELRPDSSPKTVPVCLKGCGDPPVRSLEVSTSCLELRHSGWAVGWASALASGAWAGQWPLKTQLWMRPPGPADGTRMLGPLRAGPSELLLRSGNLPWREYTQGISGRFQAVPDTLNHL